MRTYAIAVLMHLSLGGLIVAAYELMITAATDFFFLRFVGFDAVSVRVVLVDPFLWGSVFILVACSVGFNRTRDFLKLKTVKEPFEEAASTR